MECHIEQVLYRDQRTIKTRRYFEDCTGHRHQYNTCPTCRISQKYSKKFVQKQSSPSSAVSFPDGVVDDAISIRGVPNSSLYCNCHNQYCSKFKRLLYQTEVRCGCEDVSYFTEVSEKKAASCKSWFKKFHNFLLIGTYLTLVTFPYVCAVPTTISSRSTTLGAKGTKSTMNITGLSYAYHSATKASILVDALLETLKKKADNDPEFVYKGVTYDWLPVVYEPGTEAFKKHVEKLQLDQVVQETLRNITLLNSTMKVVVEDMIGDENVNVNISYIPGALSNIIDDLQITLDVNNMAADSTGMKSMPENLKKLNKTDRATRDWLIVKALADNLKYTIAVFEHFNITEESKN